MAACGNRLTALLTSVVLMPQHETQIQQQLSHRILFRIAIFMSSVVAKKGVCTDLCPQVTPEHATTSQQCIAASDHAGTG